MADAKGKGNACPNSGDCQMYSLFEMAGALAVWKIYYCNADYTRCARYKLSSSFKGVPINLMPNGVLLKHLAADKGK
jgi:hypothetical protein